MRQRQEGSASGSNKTGPASKSVGRASGRRLRQQFNGILKGFSLAAQSSEERTLPWTGGHDLSLREPLPTRMPPTSKSFDFARRRKLRIRALGYEETTCSWQPLVLLISGRACQSALAKDLKERTARSGRAPSIRA